MKKQWKILLSAFLFSLTGVFSFLSLKEQNYIQSIPKKYLLDGYLKGSDDTFDYYKITNTASLSLDESKSYYAVALKESYKITSNLINIPSTYEGGNVIGIYQNGFSNRTNLNLTIPSNIQYIDYEAFFNTSFKDKNLYIPPNVKELGVASFFNTNIVTLSFSDKAATYENACEDTTASKEASSTDENSKLETIPAFCFARCKSLKSITFSDSLTSIEEEAFESCLSLQALATLSGLSKIKSKAFRGCSSLKEVYLPSSLTKENIDAFAFENCNSSLSINANSTDLDSNFFRKSQFTGDCFNVTKLSNDVKANGSWLYNKKDDGMELIKYLGEVPNDGIIACPNTIEGINVTTIDINCFQDKQSNIKKLFLPLHLRKLDQGFFSKKYENLTYIGSMSENNCYSDPNTEYVIDLSKLEDLRDIRKGCFSSLKSKSNIEEIHLPGNLTSIGEEAFFDGFTNVKKLTFEKITATDVKTLTISAKAFCNVGQNATFNKGEKNEIVLPARTTSIGDNAFNQCNVLTHITIEGDRSSTDLTIGNQAFYNAANLEKVIIEDRKTATSTRTITIRQRAFANWTNTGDYGYKPELQYVYLPKGTTLSGNDVFDRHYRATIYFGGSTSDKLNSSNVGGGFEEATSNFSGQQDCLGNENAATLFKFNYKPNIYYDVSLDTSEDKFVYSDNDFTYVIDKTNHKAIVSKYHFDMRGIKNLTEETVTVPDSVTVGDNTYPVTEIGDNAFVSCDSYNLTYQSWLPISNSATTYRTISKIILPDKITRIGHYAFFRCVGLKTIGTSNGSMPSSLIEIGEHAFSFTGIEKIANLNNKCNFTFNNSYAEFEKPSPFTNCPNLTAITLKGDTSGTTVKLKADEKCLMDNSSNVWVVFPKANSSSTDFNFTSSAKFHFAALKLATWIKNLTISSSNYPTYADNKTIIPQALFLGYNSQDLIREKCCYKGRNRKDNGEYKSLSDGIQDASITLELGTDNTLSIPENAFLKCNISKIVLPYGNGNGTIPSKLLANLDLKADLTIYVKKADGSLSNKANTKGFLDLNGCGYTTIGESAFEGLEKLTKIDITGVTNIKANAFYGTQIGGDLKLPSSVSSLGNNCFYSTPITSLDISNTSITAIPDGAFQSCSNLSSLYLNDKITSIGKNAFDSTALTSFQVPSSVTSIGDYAFNNCTNLTSLTFAQSTNNLTLGANAFQGCTKLTQLELTGREMTVGNNCFSSCSSLQSVKVGGDVTSIGESAFLGISSLTDLTFEEGTKKLVILTNAFKSTNISSLDLSKRTMEIGNSAFVSCTKLTKVTFGSGITSIGQDAFKLTEIEEADLSQCTGLTVLNGFAECTELKKVLIPKDKITKIFAYTFYKNTNLNTVTSDQTRYEKGTPGVLLDSTITTIGKSAFELSGITFVKMEGAIKTIDQTAFQNCKSLEKLFILNGTSDFSYGSNIINGCSKLQYLFLPSTFNMKSSTALLSGLTQFQSGNSAYVCIDRDNYTFGTTTPNWLKINDAYNAQLAFKTGTTIWQFDEAKENITITKNTATSSSIQFYDYKQHF